MPSVRPLLAEESSSEARKRRTDQSAKMAMFLVVNARLGVATFLAISRGTDLEGKTMHHQEVSEWQIQGHDKIVRNAVNKRCTEQNMCGRGNASSCHQKTKLRELHLL
jgi:hypothetical protein